MFSFSGIVAAVGGKLVASLIGGGLIALVLGGTFFTIRNHYINVGMDRQAAAVAAKDNKAIERAKKVGLTVAQCFDRGGEWNVEDGSCKEGKR